MMGRIGPTNKKQKIQIFTGIQFSGLFFIFLFHYSHTEMEFEEWFEV
jgi:hypothetical protein